MPTTSILPPPYKGQNDQYPVIAIQNPYCERMVNFNNKDGFVKLRQGNDCWLSSNLVNYFTSDIFSYGAELFLVMQRTATDNRFYDVTATATFVLDHTAVSTGIAPASFYYNGLIVFCDGVSTTTYNGSAWVDGGFTFTGPLTPYGGTEYKTRAYFIGYNSTAYAFSNVDVTSGACTTIDLQDQISFGGVIYMIRPISMTQNLTADVVLSFIFSSGEILVYGGSYPNSATWGRISQFKVSKPLQYNSYVDAKGDSILFTESEVLSLRNLFANGYQKEKTDGIGSTINKRWRQCMQAYISNSLTRYVTGVYDEKNDRIVISMPRYVNPTTGALVSNTLFQLIYDFNLEAWYEYVQTDSSLSNALVVGATYFNGDIYLAVQAGVSLTAAIVMKLEGATTYVDDQIDGSGTVAIDYHLKSAPYPISKFGSNQISGLELIMKSGLYPQTNFKWIADLGRQETAAQTLADLGSGVTKPMVNVGIQDAITVQLDISGSSVSNSIGLEIYGQNLWYSPGLEASR